VVKISKNEHLKILEKLGEIRSNIWSYEWPQDVEVIDYLHSQEHREQYGSRLRDMRKQLLAEVEKIIDQLQKQAEAHQTGKD